MKPLHVIGMHGLGDNIHMRAVVRELIKTREVWLSTPWPFLYFDMPQVRLVRAASRLRTQAKNVAREADHFHADAAPRMEALQVSYPTPLVRQLGSVLAAMSATCGVPVGDFRFTSPAAWQDKARALVKTDKPILVIRPLVARAEWGGAAVRNADPGAYGRLFRALREGYFVVSVADIAPPQEWIVAENDADLKFHRGELDAEALAGLFSIAAMVYTSSGFAVPLAQAVGTPVVSVFGGYESSWSFSAGARFSPYLGIDTISPCACFLHNHACERRIDEAQAKAAIKEFAGVAHAAV